MYRRLECGIIILTAVLFVIFGIIACNYCRIALSGKYAQSAMKFSQVTISAGEVQGTIYDRNLIPLTNRETIYKAVAVPSVCDRESLAEYAVNRAEFYRDFDSGEPFAFECRRNIPESEGMTVFEMPVRYSEKAAASHVVGYLSEGEGADGIEYAYDSVLRGNSAENSVSYSVDGFGRVLIGDGKSVIRSDAKGGVVTTIDSKLQNICENCGKDIKKGAIVLADIKTGDILAMASFPSYSPTDIESALNDENLPLINRTLYSYSVGSIFKLVTAAQAIDEGLGEYMYDCGGNISVNGKNFNCHKLNGHGLQDMSDAMTNSCNTYFIGLSQSLDAAEFRELAYSLGFGRENYLCAGITGSGGVLPTAKELTVPAELANFSFGQGKLTATPLQITQLSCAIAGGGKMPVLRLIRGITVDGECVGDEKQPQISQVLDEETADNLKQMMINAVRNNEDSKVRSVKISVGAKTSTAQTGRFDKNGTELCNGWITGFFPARKPKYALTVLVEDGGYGNDCAAPVFRNIAETIYSQKNKIGS